MTSLRCEYLTDPHGLDIREPRLSWVLRSSERGQQQTAYRLLVASTPEKLAADQGDLWDSGVVKSDRMLHIAYGGKPLVSRTRCYWKVRAWDRDGAASDWSSAAFWSMGLLEPEDWRAEWIADQRLKESKEEPRPIPGVMFRKSFELAKKPKHAMVYATALGLYELSINGKKVGESLLAPEWTDYAKRVQVQAYDVSELLLEGENVIGVIAGEGWYSGRVGWLDPKNDLDVWGPYPEVCVQLEAETPDGQRTTIASDGSWSSTVEGPLRSNDLLNGEVYDARLEQPGWSAPGFREKGWSEASSRELDTDLLVWQPNEPIRIVKELKPIAVTEPQPGVYVCDLGQNLVGWSRVRLRGPEGTEVLLTHGERLNPDGTVYTDNLRSASQEDKCILDGRDVLEYEPRFTYHGFRYVEIQGLREKPDAADLTGCVFHSAAPDVGQFSCSNELINQLMSNIVWVQRGNLHSSPTDCPQRDERFGWMGDIQAFSQTAIFNMDMAAFFTKWMYDIRDAQAADGRFPDFAPHAYDSNKVHAGAPGWADAGVIVPWRAYVNYADKRILEQQYEAACRWIEYIRHRNPNNLWLTGRNWDYGDWLNGDTLILDGYPEGVSEVPKELFGTAFYAYSTELVAKMARLLGHEDDAKKYEDLAAKIRAVFRETFIEEDGKLRGDTQAGYALSLRFGLIEEEEKPRTIEHLLAAIQRYNGHVSTGIQSTHRMMLELSFNGQHDEACRLINLRTVPSWGYTIDMGATTIWERWDGYVEGRGFQNPNMNSFNHWALGSVGEWMWRVLVGIHPLEEFPGYKKFLIHPMPGPTVTWAKGEYHSIRGRIVSGWRIKEGSFLLDVEIPVGSSAEVRVPTGGGSPVTESNRSIAEAKGVELIRQEPDAVVLRVESGKYSFRSEL